MPSPSSSSNQNLILNEQEALDIILSKSVNNDSEDNSKTQQQIENLLNETKCDETINTVPDSNVKDKAPFIGNSLSGKSAWSDGTEQVTSIKSDIDNIRPSTSRQNSVKGNDVSSYNALLESYTVNTVKLDSTPDLKSIWENFYQQLSSSANEPEELDSTKPEVVLIFILMVNFVNTCEKNLRIIFSLLSLR